MKPIHIILSSLDQITSQLSQITSHLSQLSSLSPPPRKKRSKSSKQAIYATESISSINSLLAPIIRKYGPCTVKSALDTLQPKWKCYRENARKRLERYIVDTELQRGDLLVEQVDGTEKLVSYIYLKEMNIETATILANSLVNPALYPTITLGDDGFPLPPENTQANHS